jgi:hypothetical protein
MAEFNTASSSYQGDFTIKLLAQLQSTRRILDNVWFALDSTMPLDVAVDLTDILPVEAYQGWKLAAVLAQGHCHPQEYGHLGLGQPDGFSGQSRLRPHRSQRGRGSCRRVLTEHHKAAWHGPYERVNPVGRHHRGQQSTQAAVAGTAASCIHPGRKSDV